MNTLVSATIESALGGAANTTRGLTHSLDRAKEGLMPNRTADRICVICGSPVAATSRGVTCSYVCRARYREQSRTPDWSRPPREYPAELVEREIQDTAQRIFQAREAGDTDGA